MKDLFISNKKFIGRQRISPKKVINMESLSNFITIIKRLDTLHEMQHKINHDTLNRDQRQMEFSLPYGKKHKHKSLSRKKSYQNMKKQLMIRQSIPQLESILKQTDFILPTIEVKRKNSPRHVPLNKINKFQYSKKQINQYSPIKFEQLKGKRNLTNLNLYSFQERPAQNLIESTKKIIKKRNTKYRTENVQSNSIVIYDHPETIGEPENLLKSRKTQQMKLKFQITSCEAWQRQKTQNQWGFNIIDVIKK